MSESVTIEVVYALPERQSLLTINVPANCTVQQAIVRSGILDMYPDIELENQKVGIWSRAVKMTDRVKAGDRVELYRPLIADPKELRRRRAEKAKQEGRANQVTGGKALNKTSS
ncbi:MAG: RnfH family protein [Alkalimonas sp.]|nr:RnfH family protein [Alkalimonas sp.]